MFRQFTGDRFKILTDRFERRTNPLKLCAKVCLVDVRRDRLDLDIGVGALGRATPRDGDHLTGLLLVNQPVCDVDHDVADADDRDPIADLKIAAREFRQAVVVEDQILGVIDPACRVAGNAECLGPLRAGGDDDCRRLENLSHFVECQIGIPSNFDVADIPDLRIDKDLPELLANPFLQLVLVEIDAVFNQSAGLDVAIENYDVVTGLGQLSYSIGASRAGADRHYEMSTMFFLFTHIRPCPDGRCRESRPPLDKSYRLCWRAVVMVRGPDYRREVARG